MLILQIKELCALRGIKSPISALRKAGISQKVANQYISGQKQYLLLKHIESLCTLLRCTPNDLFSWTPSDQTQDYPENPLQKIRPSADGLPDLQKLIGTMSLDEVKKRLAN